MCRRIELIFFYPGRRMRKIIPEVYAHMNSCLSLIKKSKIQSCTIYLRGHGIFYNELEKFNRKFANHPDS